MDNSRPHGELDGLSAEWNERPGRESSFKHTNNLTNPSRYGRNDFSGEKTRQHEQQRISDRDDRGYSRFPESGVNSDTRGLHGGPDKDSKESKI